MRWVVLVGALAVAGCSGGGGPAADCAAIDVCAVVTLAQLNAACGTSADRTSSTSSLGDDTRLVYGCDYFVPSGFAAQLHRACFPGGAAAAQRYYDTERARAQPAGTTQADVAGLGEGAFFRYTEATTTGDLQAHGAEILVELSDRQGTGSAATETCLATLAPPLLAAR
jgi:hypothetical protein